jgi:hypothetical protein
MCSGHRPFLSREEPARQSLSGSNPHRLSKTFSFREQNTFWGEKNSARSLVHKSRRLVLISKYHYQSGQQISNWLLGFA